MNERIDVLAVFDAELGIGTGASLEEIKRARAAVAEMIEAASRHINAVDHPAMDGRDTERQAITLRNLSAALARIGGAK